MEANDLPLGGLLLLPPKLPRYKIARRPTGQPADAKLPPADPSFAQGPNPNWASKHHSTFYLNIRSPARLQANATR
eukprot:scaffold69607_cov27-Tisochrysis_lutea.AAC.1